MTTTVATLEFDLAAIDNWYTEHFEELVAKYGGKVIAMIDEEIVAVANDVLTATKLAQEKYPDRIPFTPMIPTEEDMACLL